MSPAPQAVSAEPTRHEPSTQRTIDTSSLIVTEPSPSQSPMHVGAPVGLGVGVDDRGVAVESGGTGQLPAPLLEPETTIAVVVPGVSASRRNAATAPASLIANGKTWRLRSATSIGWNSAGSSSSERPASSISSAP